MEFLKQSGGIFYFTGVVVGGEGPYKDAQEEALDDASGDDDCGG